MLTGRRDSFDSSSEDGTPSLAVTSSDSDDALGRTARGGTSGTLSLPLPKKTGWGEKQPSPSSPAPRPRTRAAPPRARHDSTASEDSSGGDGGADGGGASSATPPPPQRRASSSNGKEIGKKMKKRIADGASAATGPIADGAATATGPSGGRADSNMKSADERDVSAAGNRAAESRGRAAELHLDGASPKSTRLSALPPPPSPPSPSNPPSTSLSKPARASKRTASSNSSSGSSSDNSGGSNSNSGGRDGGGGRSDMGLGVIAEAEERKEENSTNDATNTPLQDIHVGSKVVVLRKGKGKRDCVLQF